MLEPPTSTTTYPPKKNRLGNINLEYNRTLVKKWKTLEIESGKFNYITYQDSGTVKSTNIRKELNRKKEKKEKKNQLNVDMRQEVKKESDMKRNRFFESLRENGRKRKNRDEDVLEELKMQES